MGGSWVRSRQCWGATRSVRSGVGCDGAIWGWMRWCDLGLWCVLGLDAMGRSRVVVCAISPALLSLLALGSVLFFFWKWFEGKLGDGFWIMGRHDLGWMELSWGELGYGFWIVWGVCSSFLSSVWFLEIVCRENQNVNDFTPGSPYFTVNAENNFSLTKFLVTTKHTHLRKNISISGLKTKQPKPYLQCISSLTKLVAMTNKIQTILSFSKTIKFNKSSFYFLFYYYFIFQ